MTHTRERGTMTDAPTRSNDRLSMRPAYREMLPWARDALRRLAEAEPATYTREERALVRAALLYLAARIVPEDL